MELTEAFKWRYATKKFDPGKKVAPELVDKIVEAAWMAPTSSGLQPFEVLVITNQKIKDKFVELSYGQQIVADCSHLLVFAGWENYTEEKIDGIYDQITKERNQPKDRYDAYKTRLKTNYLARSAEVNFAHIARQAYIAFGFAMAQAATLKVDSTPMEGFINDEVDKLLDLLAKGLKSVVILPIGYRDEENDWLVNLKKVRHPKAKFVTYID